MVGWVDRIQLNMDGVSGAQGGEEEKLRDIENSAPLVEKTSEETISTCK